MDEYENARLREEGRSAARNGLQVYRSIGRDSRGILLPTDVFRADQPFRTLADMYFSLQNYAIGNPRPYDDTGWTFQLMRDITITPVTDKSVLDQSMSPVAGPVTAARGIETSLIAAQLPTWLDKLRSNMKSGDLAIHNNEKWDPSSWPSEASGHGWHDAPRGALGHWIRIKDQKIFNYQAIVPSTWNASPRDAKNQRGPYEAALVGTPIADPQRPLEILRTVHSFDPCLACAVHVMDTEGNETVKVKVL